MRICTTKLILPQGPPRPSGGLKLPCGFALAGQVAMRVCSRLPSGDEHLMDSVSESGLVSESPVVHSSMRNQSQELPTPTADYCEESNNDWCYVELCSCDQDLKASTYFPGGDDREPRKVSAQWVF